MVPIRRHAGHRRAYIARWGLVLALACANLPALGQGQSQADTQRDAADSSHKPEIAPPLTVEPTYSSLIDERACQQSQDGHQADLCIAWRSAVATEKQAFWSEVACLVAIAGIFFVVRTLYYTRIAAEAARVSADAAERAVAESSRALAHAREMADQDLRPWLTVAAELDGPVRYEMDVVDGREISLFVRVKCMNVGKVAAQEVVYRVRSVDRGLKTDYGAWLNEMIEGAVHGCKYADHASHRHRPYSDSLAPSERYVRRWYCVTPAPEWSPKPGSIDRSPSPHRLCVGIVAAYKAHGSSGRVFYTAKLLPVGFPDVPTFLEYIGPDDLPLGVEDLALGPVLMAKTT